MSLLFIEVPFSDILLQLINGFYIFQIIVGLFEIKVIETGTVESIKFFERFFWIDKNPSNVPKSESPTEVAKIIAAA